MAFSFFCTTGNTLNIILLFPAASIHIFKMDVWTLLFQLVAALLLPLVVFTPALFHLTLLSLP